MKGLASAVGNTLNDYKSTVHIKKQDVLTALRAAAERASIEDSTVEPEINMNSDAQDKADCQNVFCLATIGVKEWIAEGITKIVGRDITNPILQMTDNSDFKSVDQYQIHKLFTAITEGAERPESSNIIQQLGNIVGIIFDWRDTVVTNVERMAEMAAENPGLRRARAQWPTRRSNPGEHILGGATNMGDGDQRRPSKYCCKVKVQ